MFSFNKLKPIHWILIFGALIFLLGRNKEHFDFNNFEIVNSGSLADVSTTHTNADENECRSWAQTMNKPFEGQEILCLNDTDCPKYCYVSNNKVYWNNDKRGSCSEHQKCIFKKK